jgi:activator of 2-hydroxyglutaryl-CoA dehydratase
MIENHYYLGIDIGSTTVKSVVLSLDGKVLYSTYERHNAKVKETLITELNEVKGAFPNANVAAIDYDPSTSYVNQENRLKLMLANIKKP